MTRGSRAGKMRGVTHLGLIRSLWLAAFTVGVVTVALVLRVILDFPSPFNGYDVYAYWIVDSAHPYSGLVAPAKGAFLYSPPFAYLFDPLGALPFDVLRTGWGIAQGAVLVAMTGPLAAVIVLTPPVRYELTTGNVSLFMAAAIVLARRYPAAWAFPILSKATPIVGLAWYAGRRDWRGLAIASGFTAAIVAASVLVDANLWAEWFEVLRRNAGVETEVSLGPLWLRLPLAVGACYLAGRRDWAWVVPIAVVLSLGHVWWATLCIALAAIPLWWLGPDDRAEHVGWRR